MIINGVDLDELARKTNGGKLAKDSNGNGGAGNTAPSSANVGTLEYLRSKAASGFYNSLGGTLRFGGQIADTYSPEANNGDGFLANNGKYLENLGKEEAALYKPQTEGYDNMGLYDRVTKGSLRDIAGDVAEGFGSSALAIGTSLIPGGAIVRGVTSIPKVGAFLAGLASKAPAATQAAKTIGSKADTFATRFGVTDGVSEAISDAGSNVDKFKEQGMNNGEATSAMLKLAVNEAPYLTAEGVVGGKLFSGKGGIGSWAKSTSMAKRGLANTAGLGVGMGLGGTTEKIQTQLADKYATGEDRGVFDSTAYIYNQLTGNNISGPNQEDDVSFAKGALGGLMGAPGAVYGTVRKPNVATPMQEVQQQEEPQEMPQQEAPQMPDVTEPKRGTTYSDWQVPNERLFDWDKGMQNDTLSDLTETKLRILDDMYYNKTGDHLYVTSMSRNGNGGSWHDSGQAFDVVSDELETNADLRRWIEGKAKEIGLKPLDEYEHPSAQATGGHMHFSDHGDSLGEYSGQQNESPAQDGNNAGGYDFTGTYTDDTEVNALINKYAQKYDVDPALVAGIMNAESSFDRNIGQSSAGAIGLMQLMPETAEGLGVDPYDMEQNVEGGVKELKQCLENNGGNVELALAAYNAGQGNVNKYGGIPPFAETQAYVPKVMDFYKQHSKGKSQVPASSTTVDLGEEYASAADDINSSSEGISGYDSIINDLVQAGSMDGNIDLGTSIDNASNVDVFDTAQKIMDVASARQQDNLLSTVSSMYDDGDVAGLKDMFKRMSAATSMVNPIAAPQAKQPARSNIQPNTNRRNLAEVLADVEQRKNFGKKVNAYTNAKTIADTLRDTLSTDRTSPAKTTPAIATIPELEQAARGNVNSDYGTDWNNNANVWSHMKAFLDSKGDIGKHFWDVALNNISKGASVAETRNKLGDAMADMWDYRMPQPQPNIPADTLADTNTAGYLAGITPASTPAAETRTVETGQPVDGRMADVVSGIMNGSNAENTGYNPGMVDTTIPTAPTVPNANTTPAPNQQPVQPTQIAKPAPAQPAQGNTAAPAQDTSGETSPENMLKRLADNIKRIKEAVAAGKIYPIKADEMLDEELAAFEAHGDDIYNLAKELVAVAKKAIRNTTPKGTANAERQALIREQAKVKQKINDVYEEYSEGDLTPEKANAKIDKIVDAYTKSVESVADEALRRSLLQGVIAEANKVKSDIEDNVFGDVETSGQGESAGTAPAEPKEPKEPADPKKAELERLRVRGKELYEECKAKNIPMDNKNIERTLSQNNVNKIKGVIKFLEKALAKANSGEPTPFLTDSIKGKPVTLYTDDGTELSVEYRYVPANNIVASNTVELGFPTNDNYPKELQPRDRNRSGMQAQVFEMAGNLNPAQLADSHNVNTGAPILRNDGVVLNGNGRAMAIQAATNARKAGYQKYHKYLIDNAEAFGMTADDIRSIPNGVLVRVVTEELTPAKIDRIINSKAGGATMSPAEQAKADSKKITFKTLSQYQNAKELNSAANQNFLHDMLLDIVPTNERNAMLDKNGGISPDGIARVKRALFHLAYNDPYLIEQFSETDNPEAKRIINALADCAPIVAKMNMQIEKGQLHDFKLADRLAESVKAIQHCQKNKLTFKQWAAQERTAMFDKADDDTIAIMGAFDEFKNSTAKTKSFVDDVLNAINAFADNHANEQTLPGLSVPKKELPTLAEIIEKARRNVNGTAGDLFGTDTTNKGETATGGNTTGGKEKPKGKTEKPKEQKEKKGSAGKSGEVGANADKGISTKTETPKERAPSDAVLTKAITDMPLSPEGQKAYQKLKTKFAKMTSKITDVNDDDVEAAITLLAYRAETVADIVNHIYGENYTPSDYVNRFNLSLVTPKKGRDGQYSVVVSPSRTKFKSKPSTDHNQTVQYTSKANVKTIFHELGHMFMNDLQIMSLEDKCPQQLKDDLNTITEWIKTGNTVYSYGGDFYEDYLKNKQGSYAAYNEEKWAQAWAKYVAEGSAPTDRLTKLFQKIVGRIRGFIDKYQQMIDGYLKVHPHNRNVKRYTFDFTIPDNVKACMDRMIYYRVSEEDANAPARKGSRDNTPITLDSVVGRKASRAYHGSPHDFDTFSLEGIGTGEGAQAHGWGLYFAKEKSVSENYRNELAGSELTYIVNGKQINRGNMSLIQKMALPFLSGKKTKKAVLKAIQTDIEHQKQAIAKFFSNPRTENEKRSKKNFEKNIAQMEQVEKFIQENDVSLKSVPKGKLYEVEIPEVSDMLNEDVGYDKQPDVVKKALDKIIKDIGVEDMPRDFISRTLERLHLNADRMTINRYLDVLDLKKSTFKEIKEQLENDATNFVESNYGYDLAEELLNAGYMTSEEYKSYTEHIDLIDAKGDAVLDDYEFRKDLRRLLGQVENRLDNSVKNYKAHADKALKKAEIAIKDNFLKGSGEDIYRSLSDALGGDMKASQILNDNGVKGISYNGNTDGECYVVFDDKAIQIIDKYSKQKAQALSKELDDLPKIPRSKQTVTEKLLTDFCNSFGVTLNFVDNKADVGNRGLFIANGQIYLNRSGNVPARQVFWHEFTHWLKENNPSAYKAMADAIKPTMTNARIKAYRDSVANGELLSNEDVIEEMIADGVAKSDIRKQLMQAVIDSNPSRAKRILGNLWNMYYNLKDSIMKAIDREGTRNLPKGLNASELKTLEGEIKRAMGMLTDKNGKPIFNNKNINDYVRKTSAANNIKHSTDRKYSASPSNTSNVTTKDYIKNVFHALTANGLKGKKKSDIDITKVNNKVLTNLLEDLSGYKIKWGHMKGKKDDVVLNTLAKVVRCRRANDFEMLLGGLSKVIWLNAGVEENKITPEMEQYMIGYVIDGAPNTVTAESKMLEKLMKDNPAFAEKMLDVRSTFDKWNSLSGDERRRNMFGDIDEARWARFTNWKYMYDQYVEELGPLERMVKEIAENAGKAIDVAQNPLVAFRLFRGHYGKAITMVEGEGQSAVDGLQANFPRVDFSGFKTINTILDSIGAKGNDGLTKDFMAYCVAKHYLDLHNKNEALQELLDEEQSFEDEVADARAEVRQYLNTDNAKALLAKIDEVKAELEKGKLSKTEYAKLTADEKKTYAERRKPFKDELAKLREELSQERHTRSAELEGAKARLQLQKDLLSQFRAEHPEVIEPAMYDFPNEYSKEECEKVIAKGREKFGKAQKDIVRYSHALTDIMYDSGMMSNERYNELRTAFPNYVPLHRAFHNAEEEDVFADSQKHLKGSSADVIPPIDTLIHNTFEFIKVAEKNKAKQKLANLVQLGGTGELIEVTDQANKNHTIPFMVNGKKRYLETSTQVCRAINNMGVGESVNIYRLMSLATAISRLMFTSANPAFSAVNATRDMQDSALYSKYGFGNPANQLKYLVKAAKHIGRKDSIYYEFEASGADQASAISNDRNYAQQSRNKLLRSWKKASPKEFATKLFESTQSFAEWAEALNRIAVYERNKDVISAMQMEANGKLNNMAAITEAAFESRDTMDFARGGKSSRAWNQMVPFANAAIQGLDKNYRAYKRNPRDFIGRVFCLAVLPAAGLTAISLACGGGADDDWWNELPQWQKETYYCFKIGDTIFRIPKGQDLATRYASHLTQTLMEAGLHNGNIEGKVYAKMAFDALPSLCPTVAKTAMELAADYSIFYDRDITPKSQQRLPSYLQYSPKTTETNKVIAKAFNDMGIPFLSPRQMDYAVQGTLGAPGMMLLNTIDFFGAGLFGKGFGHAWSQLDMSGANLPIFGRFNTRPNISSASVNKFYDEWNEQQKRYNEKQETGKTPKEFDWAKYERLKNANKLITDLNKREREIMANDGYDATKKRELLTGISKKRKEIAQKALNK